MLDDELKDENNWFEYGLTEHLETEEFNHWTLIGEEVARIAGAEPGSPMHDLFMQCAASASKLGFECANCNKLCAPRFGKFGVCKECLDKSDNAI